MPGDSAAKTLPYLKRKLVAFTNKNSNSGFKAPTVILMHDFGMEPERDYLWAFTFDHLDSIKAVAAKEYEVAAVASDLLQRAIAGGEVSEGAVKVIYESEPFPVAAIGHAHNLEPGLAAKLREAVLSYRFEGELAEEFKATGADRFVPINYKDDFGLVRRIDDASGFKHEIPAAPAETAPPAAVP